MNGLRVYMKPDVVEAGDLQRVFYSRRGSGPYYCWLYEEKRGEWRVSRVISTDFVPNSLSTASWKAVPTALQCRMSEHYLD